MFIADVGFQIELCQDMAMALLRFSSKGYKEPSCLIQLLHSLIHTNKVNCAKKSTATLRWFEIAFGFVSFSIYLAACLLEWACG
jgi:hypothetical protein